MEQAAGGDPRGPTMENPVSAIIQRATGASILLVAAALATGCDSGADTTSTPTVSLLVTNSSCVASHCDSIDVLLFPANQPHTPGGFWSVDLGVITTPTACIKLPASAHFYVIAAPARSSADTTTYSWTPAASFALGAIAPGGSRIMASPTTATVTIPAGTTGWGATLPGTQAAATAECTP